MWESLKPIKAFVGGYDLETAVVPQVVREMMVTFDLQVAHYEVVGAKPR